MSASKGSQPAVKSGIKKPSEEFSAYCEAEFERRLNSGYSFDERQYRRAMAVVVERLVRLEDETHR